jgi:cell division septation protein DedD
MDKALKQRLVGAIVLIIFAVIVLPMLLSGRSETLKQESRKIEVPPRPDELSLETRRFPVGVPNRPEPATQQVRATKPGSADPDPQAVADTLPPAEEAATTPGSSAESAVQEPAVEQSPVVATITVPATVEAPAPGRAVSEAEPGTPRYLVQVASFSNEKRANALAQTLREKGLPVAMDVVERTAGRMHRVRVGPYARRADADTVVSDLRDDIEGLAPRVLDLRPDDTAPVTTPSDPLVRWVVQVGSFAEQARADALITQLRGSGLPAFSEQVSSQAGTVYKVRLGPEISRDRAVELAARVKREHGLDGFVTTSE